MALPWVFYSCYLQTNTSVRVMNTSITVTLDLEDWFHKVQTPCFEGWQLMGVPGHPFVDTASLKTFWLLSKNVLRDNAWTQEHKPCKSQHGDHEPGALTRVVASNGLDKVKVTVHLNSPRLCNPSWGRIRSAVVISPCSVKLAIAMFFIGSQ